ncbi:MAG: heparan-alpha-glucosaminide N-acetyltransferase domain-containing protein [Bryobacteraceae bacterium]
MTAIEIKPVVAAPAAKKTRLAFLDWTRGLAAIIMLQGHVFHSFTRTDLRDGGAYVISQFIGGIAPAIFLFLTGVTLAFLMDARERAGLPPGRRLAAAFQRAGFLALLAVLFRFQLWLFGQPYTAWTDLLRVDILNCMAVSILAVSFLAVFTTAERARNAVVIGLAIAVASPVVSMIDPASIPEHIRMYMVPDNLYFSFFPWGAFVAFGLSAGSILRLVTADQMHRVMQWCAITGFGLIITAQYFSNLPYSLYSNSDFWLNSPGLILIKLGVILVLLSFTFLWTHHGAGEGWSWVRQLGVTSLLVYWVHIELVYGRWFGYWKESLTYGQCALAAGVLTVAMLALSAASTHWQWRGIRSLFDMISAPVKVAKPARVSGD